MDEDFENDDGAGNTGSERTDRVFFRVRPGDVKLMRAFHALLQATRTPAERMAIGAALGGQASVRAPAPAPVHHTPDEAAPSSAPPAAPFTPPEGRSEIRERTSQRPRKALVAIVADPDCEGPDRRTWSIAFALQAWFETNGTPCVYRAIDAGTRTRECEALVDQLMSAASESVLLIDVAWSDGVLDWIEAAGLLDAVDDDELSIAVIAGGASPAGIVEQLRAALGETAFVTHAQRDAGAETADDAVLTLPPPLDADLGARVRELRIALRDARQAREAIGFVASAKLDRYAGAVFAEFDRMAKVLAP